MELSWAPVSLFILVLVLVSRIRKVADGKRAIGNLPGLLVAFRPFGFPGVLLPTTWWNPGVDFVWHWKDFRGCLFAGDLSLLSSNDDYVVYKQFNADTISIVSFLTGSPTIVTSNMDVARHVLGNSNKALFGRTEMDDQGPLGYWGVNLFIAEDYMWKKHRRIVGSAFSQKLYELVWNESQDLYYEMLVAEGFKGKKIVEITKVQQITFSFAFLVIGRCGFGFPFSWTEKANKDSFSFPEAAHIFTKNLHLIQLPKMILGLPITRFRQLNEALIGLRKFMVKQIVEKNSLETNNDDKDNRDDIFSKLIHANHAQSDAKLKLDDSELISNVFLMLLAGHETTAHTLAATMACLARHQEYQQEIFEEIKSVIGNDRSPTFEDFPKLNKVQACFYEALRIFPTGFAAIREVKANGTLSVPRLTDDGTTTIPLQKGTHIIVDLVGIHRNPSLFREPEKYQPSRWYGLSNESEALAVFGLGQRSCIGRRFAITESVCLIAMFLRDWKIEPLTQPGESIQQWFRKISQARVLLTLAVGDVGLRFVRRG